MPPKPKGRGNSASNTPSGDKTAAAGGGTAATPARGPTPDHVAATPAPPDSDTALAAVVDAIDRFDAALTAERESRLRLEARLAERDQQLTEALAKRDAQQDERNSSRDQMFMTFMQSITDRLASLTPPSGPATVSTHSGGFTPSGAPPAAPTPPSHPTLRPMDKYEKVPQLESWDLAAILDFLPKEEWYQKWLRERHIQPASLSQLIAIPLRDSLDPFLASNGISINDETSEGMGPNAVTGDIETIVIARPDLSIRDAAIRCALRNMARIAANSRSSSSVDFVIAEINRDVHWNVPSGDFNEASWISVTSRFHGFWNKVAHKTYASRFISPDADPKGEQQRKLVCALIKRIRPEKFQRLLMDDFDSKCINTIDELFDKLGASAASDKRIFYLYQGFCLAGGPESTPHRDPTTAVAAAGGHGNGGRGGASRRGRGGSSGGQLRAASAPSPSSNSAPSPGPAASSGAAPAPAPSSGSTATAAASSSKPLTPLVDSAGKSVLPCWKCGGPHHINDCPVKMTDAERTAIVERKRAEVKAHKDAKKSSPSLKVARALDGSNGCIMLGTKTSRVVPYIFDSGADITLASFSELKLAAREHGVSMVPLKHRMRAQGLAGELLVTHRVTLPVVQLSFAEDYSAEYHPVHNVEFFAVSQNTPVLIGQTTLLSVFGIDVSAQARARVVEAHRQGTTLSDSPAAESDLLRDSKAYRVSVISMSDPTNPPHTSDRADYDADQFDHFQPSAAMHDPVKVSQQLSSAVSATVDAGASDAFAAELDATLRKFAHMFREFPDPHDPPADVPPVLEVVDPSLASESSYQPKFPRVVSDAVAELMERWVKVGALERVQPGEFAYASPVRPVLRSGHDPTLPPSLWYRLTFNFIKANGKTKPVVANLPDINDLKQYVAGKRFFAKLDLWQGFWQLALHPDCQKYFCVRTDRGFFRPLRCMQGMMNIPGWFQSAMVATLGELLYNSCIVFIDDILIFADSEDELLSNTRAILERLCARGFKVSSTKCQFFARAIEYCGRVFSEDGWCFDPAYVKTVSSMPPPETLQQLRQFLGMLTWLSPSVIDFQRRIAQLQDLSTAAQQLARARSLRPTQADRLPLSECGWSSTHNDAFQQITTAIVANTHLADPADDDDDFVRCLYADASDDGWCGVITRTRRDQLHLPILQQTHYPLAFTSGRFTGASASWPIVEKEAFAIKETLVRNRFLTVTREPIRIFTDHRNLKYLFNPVPARLEGRKQAADRIERWFVIMSSFHYTIDAIAGTDNIVADLFSRWGLPPQPELASPTDTTPAYAVVTRSGARAATSTAASPLGATTAVPVTATDSTRRTTTPTTQRAAATTAATTLPTTTTVSLTAPSLTPPSPRVARGNATPVAVTVTAPTVSVPVPVSVPVSVSAPVSVPVPVDSVPVVSVTDAAVDGAVTRASSSDSDSDSDSVSPLPTPNDIASLSVHDAPSEAELKHSQSTVSLVDIARLRLIRDASTGLLVTAQQPSRVYVPDHRLLRLRLAICAHQQLHGHRGTDTTFAILRQHFWWPGLRRYVREFTHRCLSCMKTRGGKVIPRSLSHIPRPTTRNTLVAFDFLSIRPATALTPNGFDSIFVMIDCFSSYVELFPCSEKTARVAAESISAWCSRFGPPPYWMSDQGPHFANDVLSTLATTLGVEHQFTTVYSPWSNGIVERCNQEILSLLRSVLQTRRLQLDVWPQVVPVVQFLLNNTVTRALAGYAPRTVMFGMEPTSPFNVVYRPDPFSIMTVDTTRDTVVKSVEAVHSKLSSILDSVSTVRDSPVRSGGRAIDFDVGDHVLVSAATVEAADRDKIGPVWLGPALVTARKGPKSFEVFDHATQSSRVLHARHLKRYADSSLTVTDDIRAAAAHGVVGAAVSFVRSHRLTDDGACELLVQFEPDGSTPLWIPFDQFAVDKSTGKLRTYLSLLAKSDAALAAKLTDRSRLLRAK